MPKNKLTAFEAFSKTLLPHQIYLAASDHQLTDPQKISILRALEHNCFFPGKPVSFSTAIDKRKYSYIKNWIKEKLQTYDVDMFYQWLCDLDHKIMTDDISLDDEKDIIKYINAYSHPTYYFIRFYELMQNYRHFLLIRVRHDNYRIVGNFLLQYEADYKTSQSVYQQLHEATHDIVSQYRLYNDDSRKWEGMLVNVFSDETMDGLNRYFAIVRLTFLYYVYKEYDRLLDLFDKLDDYFRKGIFYSPRILVNYYANRLLVHARENDLTKACNYGYLSIRYKSNDYLQYLNNLSAVLMRAGKHSEALSLLYNAFPDFRKTLSSHNRIGFASFYTMALIRNRRAGEAVSYAAGFLAQHRDDIIRNRWHLFFTSYCYALLETENYAKILSVTRKYNLLGLEESYRKKAGYIPSFIWIYELARYKELLILQEQLYASLYETSLPYIPDEHKFRLMKEICQELSPHEPVSFRKLHDKLFLHSNYKVTPGFLA